MNTRSLRIVIALWMGVAGVSAGADPAAAPAPAGAPDPAAGVGLDSLLKLPPSSGASEAPRTGGASRQEWEQRFATARGDVAAAQKALDKAQTELDRAASGTSTWQMSAPGVSPQPSGENAPVSFKLRQEIRKQREELAAAQKRLTELEVEAKLAGVPDEWMGAEPAPEPPNPSPTQDATAQ